MREIDKKPADGGYGVPVCEDFAPHEENIAKCQNLIKDIEGLEDLFKALADRSRLKIIYALYGSQELCVCDLSVIAGISVAAASHHLRLLYQSGLAKYEKRGKYVYYSLDDDHVRDLLAQALDHWRHQDKNTD